MLLALVASLLVGLPAAFLVFADGGAEAGGVLLLLDGVMALAVTAAAWPERKLLLRLLATGAWAWWPLAIAVAAALPALPYALAQAFPEQFSMDDGALVLGLSPLVGILAFCVLPGIFEEIAFRGVVLETGLQMTTPARAQLLTAALFAAVHLRLLAAPYLFLFGLILGLLRRRSGSLYPCILAHVVHNAAVIYLWPAVADATGAAAIPFLSRS